MIQKVKEEIKICLSNYYKNTFFISKSFGGSVAGEISKFMGYDKVNNLFLTPAAETIPHIINSDCTVVVGSKDKAFYKENIDKVSKYPSVDLHILENASHSLEIDNDYKKSLEILIRVTDLCESFVCKGRSI